MNTNDLDRRSVLHALALGAAAVTLHGQPASSPAAAVKALVFDTFGTVVDWRGSIIVEGTALGQAKGLKVDWARFADRWRGGYAPAMERDRKCARPWTNLDALPRTNLDHILVQF